MQLLKRAQKEKSEEVILENEIIPNAETEEDIIRGRASKLKGTKVLGKGAFTSEKSSDKQPRKKRKRKKTFLIRLLLIKKNLLQNLQSTQRKNLKRKLKKLKLTRSM